MLFVLKKGSTKKQMNDIHSKIQTIKGVDTKKYCGTIKLKENPSLIQKQMRDEW
jgi:hypothetical protein